jgi:hypothetical protein
MLVSCRVTFIRTTSSHSTFPLIGLEQLWEIVNLYPAIHRNVGTYVSILHPELVCGWPISGDSSDLKPAIFKNDTFW